MSEQGSDGQQRDKLVLRLLETPPQPRPKRERPEKPAPERDKESGRKGRKSAA
jgi:hypothetical protein